GRRSKDSGDLGSDLRVIGFDARGPAVPPGHADVVLGMVGPVELCSHPAAGITSRRERPPRRRTRPRPQPRAPTAAWRRPPPSGDPPRPASGPRRVPVVTARPIPGPWDEGAT